MDKKIRTKLNRVSKVLKELDELTKQNLCRKESFEIAHEVDNLLSYAGVDLAANLLAELAAVDRDRITEHNAQRILSQYPSGFYRSELQTYLNEKKVKASPLLVTDTYKLGA